MNSSFIEKLNNKLNMIELTSKPIVENDAAWQQHGTPNKVIDMMLDMYYENGEFKNNEKILILFNVEFIKQIYFKYKDELIFGNLYFIADSKEKFDIVNKLYPNVHCLFCNEHTIEKLMEKIGEFNVKKFDVVFSNPPYNHALDIKILNNLKKFSNSVIFVHPAVFILDKKFKSSCFNEIRNTKSLESIKLFWGNNIFKIGLYLPVCISKWDFSKKFENVQVTDNAISFSSYEADINEISIYGNEYQNVLNLILKIKNFIKDMGSIVTHRTNFDYSNITDYSVKFSTVRGHAPSEKGIHEDFFSLICVDKKENYCNKNYKVKVEGYKFNLWSFVSEDERLNFITYCKSKFCRFCYSFFKQSAAITSAELEYIPWFDFTQEWNDAKLCKEFGISEELWKYIDNFIPNYYDDYKSGFEKDEEK